MPLPNARAVPAGLAGRLAPAVAVGFTGRVRLCRPDQQPVRDPVTGRTTFTPSPAYYEGPARIQSQGGGPPTTTPSDRNVATSGFLVCVPHTVGAVRPYDVVDVVDGGDDPTLTGLRLVVDEVGTATITVQRNLTCSRHTGAAAGT